LAQGYFKADYYLSSSLKNDDGDNFGKSDLLKISGRYTLPFSIKQNSSEQPIVWSATLGGSYGIFGNKRIEANTIPDEIINLNLTLSHIRPLSQKWYMIASLGAGIYSEPDAIAARSVLINGGAIFVYKWMRNLDIGIGAGVTTSYGTPMAVPMSFIKWDFTCKYELKVEAGNTLQISGSAKLNDKLKLKLVALENDGISAVMKIDGKSMIYSSVITKMYLTPEYKIGKLSTLYVGLGATMERTSKLSERSVKYFWELFKKDGNKLRFDPTGFITFGFRYGF